MLSFLRRSHLVPVLLLLAMPGVGGTLVQAGHDCAATAPWTAPALAAAEHGHHGHGDGAPADDGRSGHQCECVGACSAPGALAIPAMGLAVVAATPDGLSQARIEPAADAPRTRPDRLLPPANAPPLI
jgi:hypothetical protein